MGWDGEMEDFDGDEAGQLDEGAYDALDEYYYSVDEEAGILEWLIPVIAAEEEKKRSGGRTRRSPRGKGRVRRGRRPRRSSMGRLAKKVNWNGKQIAALRRQISRFTQNLDGDLRNLSAGVKANTLIPDPVNAHGSDALRPLMGSTVALAAPGGAGMIGVLGPLNIVGGTDVVATHIVAEIAEDTGAAAAVPAPPPYILTIFSVATENLMKSNANAVPGNLFSTNGGNYGFPVGAGRTVRIPSGTTSTLQGLWSGRAIAGGNAGDFTASFVARQSL